MRALVILVLSVVSVAVCAQTDSDSTIVLQYNAVLGAVDVMDEEADVFGETFFEEGQDIPERAFLVDFAHGKHWMLWQPLTYRIKDSGLSITVPAGFVTDLVSTPRAVWSIVPPTGRYQRAAIIHDWLYWMQPCTRSQSDRIMVLAMEELGVSAATRLLVYEALERFGDDAWVANQEARTDALPRVVPENMWNQIPDDVSWPNYRQALARQNVPLTPQDIESPTFCAQGN